MAREDEPLFDLGLRTFAERIKGEGERRGPAVLSFGVRYLDQALGGIFKNDLILIGAKTGHGKTDLATYIAMHNAAQGKRVHYFALEAEDIEIERRVKYRHISKAAYRIVGDRLNYLDWYAKMFESELAEVERMAEHVLMKRYETLWTFYRGRDFTVDDLEKKCLAIQDLTDLIVIDHLHFVDSDDPNENRGFKAIVKRIRDIALSIGRPVLLIAHVRKGDRRFKQIIPATEDFHGTSDIIKIATKAVLMAPALDRRGPNHTLWPTYMHAAKCRPDGTRTRYVGLLHYDICATAYDDYFDLGVLVNDGSEWERLSEEKKPHWAKGMM